MAYCKSCGAYIPDGLTACLACGYDENSESQKTASGSGASSASASAASARAAGEKKGGKEKYRHVDSEFLKQQLEEQRRRQQESSRKWAETEYAQRQKAKEEQTRNFTSTSGKSTESSFSGSDVYRTVRSAMENKDNSKTCAALSYFPGFFLFSKLVCKDDQFVAYHAKQGRNLFLAGLLGTWLIPGLALPAWAYMIYRGVNNAVKGEKKPLPYIGDLLK